MAHYDQGPGRNIDFCLLTTGIDIDPHHGGVAEVWYEWFKNILIEKSELHYENDEIREIFSINASPFLPAYSTNPRTVYQFLFGFVSHNNAWNELELVEAINAAPIPKQMRPNDGEYSIAFENSKVNGMLLFENVLVGVSNVWAEKQEFYMSSRLPNYTDGNSGDVWLVAHDGIMDLWHKPVFKWSRLNDRVIEQSPMGVVSYSDIDPGNTTNSWWYDITGISFRQYTDQTNSWMPSPPIVVSNTPPAGLSNGNLWLKIESGTFVLSVWDATQSIFTRVNISDFPVQDEDDNSAFKWVFGDNNFDLTCDDDAFLGGPIGGGGNSLEIRKDGALIQTAVECINFTGPDIEVTSMPGCVDVEHLPITTLPEQALAPLPTADAGKIFTLEINGATELFYLDDNNNAVQLTNQGSTAQNIFLSVATFNAVAGQTVFTVPATAKAVIAVKINGLDTVHWTFTSPSVTYQPIPAGYIVEVGDMVSVVYYG